MATSRATSAALVAASWIVLMVFTAATLPTGTGEGILTSFVDPGCSVTAQSTSAVDICHNTSISAGGLRFVPTKGVSAAFFASPGCPSASLVGVLPGAGSLLGGVTGALGSILGGLLGGILGPLIGSIGGVTGTPAEDGSLLFCRGDKALSFQSFKLLASSK